MTKLSNRLAKLKTETSELEKQANELEGIYQLSPAMDLAYMRHEPPPRKIFGTMFFEGEISYLFAPPARGKSILAVQLADAISRGTNCCGFPNDLGPQLVAMFDFEMTNKQFMERYISDTDRDKYHHFHPNFLRAAVSHPKAKSAKDAARKLLEALKFVLSKLPVKILIIDNLTRIGGDISEGSAAFEVVTYLDNLKKEGYSILILGHAKKGDYAKFGIDENDAIGSSMVNNFIDGSFALGCNATNKSVRYLKQIKCRSGIASDDVIVLEQEKKDGVFLQLTYRGLAAESEQLKTLDTDQYHKLETVVLQHAADEANSLNRIAKIVNESGEFKQRIYPTTVSRIIAKKKANEAQEKIESQEDDGDILPDIFRNAQDGNEVPF
jgi:hypothetical protein